MRAQELLGSVLQEAVLECECGCECEPPDSLMQGSSMCLSVATSSNVCPSLPETLGERTGGTWVFICSSDQNRGVGAEAVPRVSEHQSVNVPSLFSS